MQVIEAPTRVQNKHSSSFDGADAKNVLLLAASCILLFFAGLSTWGFIDPGDGYFSEAAREMIERGDYIVPHLNYQIYFSKPILIFWMIIGSYKVFGINEFAARFSSAALATAATMVCYWCTRCLFNKRAGLIAAIAFCTSPLVVTFARMSLIDMGFAALLGIAMMATAMTLFSNSTRWWHMIYISLGLALLDKGPAAAVIYGLGLFSYLLATRPSKTDLWQTVLRMRLLPGAIITALVALPWYVAVAASTHGLWTQVFFFFENFGRFTGHTNHKNPFWWFYLPVVAYGFFPWAFLLPASFAGCLRKAIASWQSKRTDGPPYNAELFFACWSAAVLIFFSLSLTKLQTYVLPAWPALAISTGILLDRRLSCDKPPGDYARTCGWLLLVCGLLAGAAALVFVAFACGELSTVKLPANVAAVLTQLSTQATAAQQAGAVAAIFIGSLALVACAWQIRRDNLVDACKVLGCGMVISCTIGGVAFYQIGYALKNADLHRVIACIKDKPGPVALFRDFKPSAVFHLQRPIDTFFSCDQLHGRKPGDTLETQYIIAGPKGASDLLAAYPTQLRTVSQSGDWYVFATRDLLAVRLPTLEQSFTQHIDLSGGEFSWGTLPFAGGTRPDTTQHP